MSNNIENLKTHAVKQDYHITVASKGATITTVQVRASSVREALQEAYRTISGWQFKPDDFVE